MMEGGGKHGGGGGPVGGIHCKLPGGLTMVLDLG